MRDKTHYIGSSCCSENGAVAKWRLTLCVRFKITQRKSAVKALFVALRRIERGLWLYF